MTLAWQGGSRAVAGHFDETAGPASAPDWRRLLAALEDLGDAEFARRWQEGQRLIQENGVTYNVYADPRGMDRPWQLDPVPMLIASDEWPAIEAAVSQRAALLDRMLADLYGPASLLHGRHLPPELVLGHPGFLRPCRGLEVPHGCHLHVYAADLARSPDGQWWVLADRTQAPSGAGYALENRVVLSRILPEVFGTFYVRRLASYFEAYRETLMRLAPGNRDNPRVVLLTPGPYNETHFEHAFLARYLGFPLVEGADLTVRDSRVLLKTLNGLFPVDVILRRLDAAFCDPLELLGESALGVAGLVQAVRAGNVAVANALGSGLVETAATMAFLPGLCRKLLGEELKMPSVATWWCGQEREREYVLANLASLVIKPTHPGAATRSRQVVFGGELSAAEREQLAGEIRRVPDAFVAQERVALSTAPTASEGGAAPRHVVLRVYAAARNGSWTVMPGGLTRVSSEADSLVVSSQQGGGSKDTWVLADAPVVYTSRLDRVRRPIDVSRASFALTSRVADNLLWLGRMSERVDAGLRAFRAALRQLVQEPIRPVDAPPRDAVVLLARLGWLGRRKRGAEGAPSEEAVVAALYDRSRPGSLGQSVGELHRLASLLRDRISPDAWSYLARLDQEFAEPELHPALRTSGALQLVDRTLMLLSAFTGLVMESMTRGLGWQVLDIGRRFERALQGVDLLRHSLLEPGPDDPRRLEQVLAIADSAMTYRSRYQTSLQLPLVIDLLLLDEANPRSVAHQLARLAQRFRQLPRAPGAGVAELQDMLRGADPSALAAAPVGARERPGLAALLSELAQRIPSLAEDLGHAYLSHAVPRRQPPGVPRPR